MKVAKDLSTSNYDIFLKTDIYLNKTIYKYKKLYY